MKTLYSPLKFLGYQEQLQALRDGRVVAPVHVRIKPTNTCNHHCWYCAYRTDDLHLGADMDERDQIPADKMREIVDDLITMGVKAVTFSGGGEPLLYKPLPETIESLARAGIRVATLTNGANLKGRVAAALADHATWVRVSVDAWDNASYSQSRGAKPGEFDRLLENMRGFVATGTRCVLGVSFIVSKDNYRYLPQATRQFRAAGAGHIKLSAVVLGNTVEENNDYFRTFAGQARPYLEEALAMNDKDFQVLDHFHEMTDRFDKPYTSCPFLQFLTVIGADQKVYTCQDKAYTEEGRLGSIEGTRFRDFWFSAANRQAMQALDPSTTCRHHCVSHRKNLSILEYLSLDQEHACFV
jgi:MoaA/NifB/PqqE/SkfB family radical SAM enzyme